MAKPDQRQSKREFSGIGLLTSIMISLLVLPFLEDREVGRPVLVCGYSLLLLISVISVKTNFRLILISMLVVALPAGLASLLVQQESLFVAFCLAGSGILWYAGIKIVISTLAARAIEFDSIMKAVSSYLLFGLGWALTYWAVCTVDDSAFYSSVLASDPDVRQEGIDFSTLIYYSFVTMSTLGYGDIVPNGAVTRTLAWMQSVTGQFYVAVAIAWLVSSLPRVHELHPDDRA